jgi:hypothetical protein
VNFEKKRTYAGEAREDVQKSLVTGSANGFVGKLDRRWFGVWGKMLQNLCF